MSQQTVCDGCGKRLTQTSPATEPAISGERANGQQGGGLPNGRFDWCAECAHIAVQAVEQARAQ